MASQPKSPSKSKRSPKTATAGPREQVKPTAVKAAKREPSAKREPPPLSLTLRWDKVKWHADGEGLPPGVTGLAAGRHVFAALDFLGVVGQLTAEGKREQAGDLGASTALLRQHVKAGARSFLDATYASYLEAMNYGEEPPVAILKQAWAEWTQRYDVSKRPLANAYQKLLMERSPGNDLEGLLAKLADDAALTAALRDALPQVPEADRGLAKAVLSVLADGPLKAAKQGQDPLLLARALRYSRDAEGRFKAALLLERKLRGVAEALEPLIWAVNVHDAKASDPALAALSPRERTRLRDLAHDGFLAVSTDADSRREYPWQFLAICAMRAVGDESSLKLLEQHPPRADEGSVTQYTASGKERTEPMSAEVRRDVKRRVAARSEA